MSERFKVDLRGIIDLAANHMYSSPSVFIREVIQNAVDAISARRQLEPAHQGLVRLELTPASEDRAATLCVHDNGVGLTLEEVHSFLSTVGGSSKRDEAQANADRIHDDRADFLGKFGIGLLSCFMVSEEIVVVTRSSRGAGGVEWRGRADGSYSVRELSSEIAPGTSVYLTAKPGEDEYFTQEGLVEQARRYAEMLPVAIVAVMGGEEVTINRSSRPWELDSAGEVELADLCQHALGFRPLDWFPLRIEAGEIAGYAFIRPDRQAAWGSPQRLYAKGMYVSDHPHGLVPQWASFIGCILNTHGLRLTASREDIHHDESLTNACEAIGAAIRGRLAHLLRHDRGRFEAVMAVHDTEIRALAVKNSEFFEVIIDLLEFDTTLGRVRFGEFWREHDTLLVARTAEQYRRILPLARSSGVRVFNGGFTFHEELLSRAAQRHPELRMQTFDSADLVSKWQPPQDEATYQALIDAGGEAVAHREAELIVRAFEPSETGAFFAIGLDAEFHAQLDKTKSRASGLWQEILDAMAPRPEGLPPTRLCLNANCPLVQRLALIRDPMLQRTGVEVLFVQALMSGQHAITAKEMELLNAGLGRLLDLCQSGGIAT